MTEREFDQKVERAAANFERRVETVADHLDKTVNCAWNRSRLFRCVSRGTSLAAEVGLLLIAGVWRIVETELLRRGVRG